MSTIINFPNRFHTSRFQFLLILKKKKHSDNEKKEKVVGKYEILIPTTFLVSVKTYSEMKTKSFFFFFHEND